MTDPETISLYPDRRFLWEGTVIAGQSAELPRAFDWVVMCRMKPRSSYALVAWLAPDYREI
jgi:hypothetical protein